VSIWFLEKYFQKSLPASLFKGRTALEIEQISHSAFSPLKGGRKEDLNAFQKIKVLPKFKMEKTETIRSGAN
jgi:hypothetical protein